MLNLLSAIDWSKFSTEVVTTVIGAIFTAILIPLIINLFKKRNEKRKAAKKTKRDAKKDVENFLKQQFNHINTISDGFSIKTTTLDETWDFGISRQLTLEEIEENNKALEQNKQAPNYVISCSIDGFITELKKEKRALIVGDAGQGKSVFVKKICNCLYDQTTKDKPFFPIYVEIKNVVSHLSKDTGNIIEAVFNTINVNIDSFDYISKKYEICYIFDAIDEVSPNDFTAFKTLVADSLSDSYLIFSSRPGQADICNSNELRLSQDILIRKWILDEIADDKLKDFLKNDELYNAILDAETRDPNYKKLSRNPLLLCLIKNVYENNAKNLPQSRVVLFDLVIKELIQRDMAKENSKTYTSTDISAIKEVLGQVSYKIYQKKDGKSVDWLDVDSLLRGIINIHQEKDTLKHFFQEHTLVDENGFSHELFASYYCAYYLYKCICDNNRINEIVKEINKQADYWKEVVKTLLCLFEQNAQRQFNDSTEQRAGVEERLKMLLTMLKTMQGLDDNFKMVKVPLVDEPDYDILCDAVSQFIDTENNKPLAEEVLIRGMLIRGEKGVTNYDYVTHEIKDEHCTNPYEELFYYTVLYDFKGGLESIYNKQCKLAENEEGALSPIQCYLFNEICDVEHCDYTLAYAPLIESVSIKLKELSIYSGKRVGGHIVVSEKLFLGCPNITSVKILESVSSPPLFRLQSLYRIIVDKKNPYFYAIDDCVIGKGTNTLILGCKNSKIPNYVTSIGDSAFEGCTSLTSITIPNSVTSIEWGAFRDCTGLEKIMVDAKNAKYHSKDNCLIETDTNKLILGCKNSIIPNSITRIGDSAFAGGTSLTSITIPNSVTRIGDYAFEGCTGLTSINIPNSVTSIGYSAFKGCTSLTSITIPNSVTSIGYFAFSRCTGLEKIMVDAKNANYHSKDNCLIETDTNKLILGCKNSIIPNSITRIGDYAFAGCTSLTSINIPNSVTRIGDSAFEGCSSLTSISIPNSVPRIGDYAFAGCTSLTSITIPNSVTSIGDYAFEGCTSLTSISIPNSVTSIGYSAFKGCTSLTSITIPNSVTSIGYSAFKGCTSLTSITIPNSVTSIEWGAFRDCTGLEKIMVDAKNAKYHSKDNCLIETDTNKLILGCKNSIIPNSITRIGDSAFAGGTSLTSITIPNSVTRIGDYAFEGCTGLTSINIPNSVTRIGYFAFSGCTGLEKIMVDAKNANYHSKDNCLIETDTNKLILGCNNSIIPNSITRIGDFAFIGCRALTSLDIPNSVTSIGDYAFAGCTSLTSITIPNSVTSIGDSAFEYCNNLISVKFEDPNGWYVTEKIDNFKSKQDGIPVDVSDPEKNATYFKSTYKNYYYKD